MRVDISVAGDVQLSRELLRIADRTVNAKPAFERLLDYLADHEREQFDSSGGLASGGWPGLADSTIKRKLASTDPVVRGNANKVLRATEALMDSLTSRSGGGDALRAAESDELLFGTTVSYARFHQRGEGVPRRRPLELRESDRQHIVRTLQRYLLTGQL